MSCNSKWCSWIQAISQIAIAVVVVFAGLTINDHMESWTQSFTRGSDDIHSIRKNMNNIAYSMESINNDMDDIKNQVKSITKIGTDMEVEVSNMNSNLQMLTQQFGHMNDSVNNIRNNFSPQGMVRSMMPF